MKNHRNLICIKRKRGACCAEFGDKKGGDGIEVSSQLSNNPSFPSLFNSISSSMSSSSPSLSSTSASISLSSYIQHRLASKISPSAFFRSHDVAIVLLLTSVTSIDSYVVSQIVHSLGGSIANSLRDDVTHVVTSSVSMKKIYPIARRTMKYMYGLLIHAWVVSLDWIFHVNFHFIFSIFYYRFSIINSEIWFLKLYWSIQNIFWNINWNTNLSFLMLVLVLEIKLLPYLLLSIIIIIIDRECILLFFCFFGLYYLILAVV